MNNRGYIYTLITVMLVLIILSLVSYYVVISAPAIGDIVGKIRTDELYYFVESVKMDYDRSVSVSGQRAFTYLIDYSIKNNAAYDGYVMDNCTSFNPEVNGSQAAAMELMLCGTLHGRELAPKDFMENHTILDWVEKMRKKGDEMNFVVEARLRNIRIIPYDSWNFYIASNLDLTIHDKLNQSMYREYNIPVISSININNLEDPIYSVRTGSHDFVRYFTPCNQSSVVNSSVVENWIESECYMQNENAPSFFDRLDGNLNKSQKYILQSKEVEKIGLEPKALGIEGFLDLDKLASHNISVEYNQSWIDHYYWLNLPAYCSMPGLGEHQKFKIDFDHSLYYEMKNLNCSITTENSFNPSYSRFPVNTTATWININPAESCILSMNARGWEDTEISPGQWYSWHFNETGTYTTHCSLSSSGNVFSGMIYIPSD